MYKKPALYKTLVVGVIVLLILTCYPVIPGISAPNNTKNCGWVPPDNKPPEAPTIDGPANVKPGVELCWTFQSIDPDDDDVMYIIDWGDETIDETNYIQSDTPVEACHTYEEKDAYLIRARAIDIYGYKGEWSTYYIPKNEDDCKICQPVSKPYLVLIKSLLNRLENYLKLLLSMFKDNSEVENRFEEMFTKFNVPLIVLPDFICNILLIFWVIGWEIITEIMFRFNIGGIILFLWETVVNEIYIHLCGSPWPPLIYTSKLHFTFTQSNLILHCKMKCE